MDRQYLTCLTFMPTPLEVTKSSLVALIIFNVFCYYKTDLLHKALVTLDGTDMTAQMKFSKTFMSISSRVMELNIKLEYEL
jgi:hypothetical protein